MPISARPITQRAIDGRGGMAISLPIADRRIGKRRGLRRLMARPLRCDDQSADFAIAAVHALAHRNVVVRGTGFKRYTRAMAGLSRADMPKSVENGRGAERRSLARSPPDAARRPKSGSSTLAPTFVRDTARIGVAAWDCTSASRRTSLRQWWPRRHPPRCAVPCTRRV